MQSVNGIGATFYGKKDMRDDGSYITTKWFIFLYIPVIPLRSYRVKKISQSKYGRTEYEILQELPLTATPALKIYVISVLILLPILVYLLFAN